jgi:hypothetical protein
MFAMDGGLRLVVPLNGSVANCGYGVNVIAVTLAFIGVCSQWSAVALDALEVSDGWVGA